MGESGLCKGWVRGIQWTTRTPNFIERQNKILRRICTKQIFLNNVIQSIEANRGAKLLIDLASIFHSSFPWLQRFHCSQRSGRNVRLKKLPISGPSKNIQVVRSLKPNGDNYCLWNGHCFFFKLFWCQRSNEQDQCTLKQFMQNDDITDNNSEIKFMYKETYKNVCRRL